MTTTITYVEGGRELLDHVEPMWQKLNEHHARLSPHFRLWFETFTFARRRQTLLARAEQGELLVILAKDATTGGGIGYCVSSVTTDKTGEIESIWVDPARRRSGVGRELMRRSLAWLEAAGATQNVLIVAVGNEQAIDFYKHFDFYPASIKLSRRRPARA